MELLAPVGTMENFLAALEAGADAVFLGGKAFGARTKAANFGHDELVEVVRLAHLLGVAVHVTVNIIVGDEELKELRKYLIDLNDIGVDAIIVQDLAVAQLAKEVAPNLELHASTQLTVTNLETIKFFEAMGFTRIVLARELSLEEMKYIVSHTKLEIEAFIHGALCICYSGQCLMSSFIGGRSGNRGACAQPCRLPYELLDSQGKPQTKKNETYLMSPKDLNYSEYIGQLIEAGVDSFKVEGRMKKVSYVRSVIGAYRDIMDAHGQVKAEDKKHLSEGFNRGFSTAYLENRPGYEMMTIVAPNNQGKKVGQCVREKSAWLLKLEERVDKGDLLKIISPQGSVSYVTVDENWKLTKDGNYTGQPQDQITDGIVYLAATAQQKKTFRGLAEFKGKYNISAYLDGKENEPVSLTLLLEDGLSVTVQNDYILQVARKVATPEDKLREQLGRLGNTVFTLKELSYPTGNYMWSSSVLNELRRDAVTLLELELLKRYELEKAEKKVQRLKQKKQLIYTTQEAQDNKVETDDGLTEANSSLRGPDSTLIRIADLKPQNISEKARTLYKVPIISAHVDEVEQVEWAIRYGAQKIIFGGDRLQREPYTLGVYQEVVDICKKSGVYVSISTPRIVPEQERTSYEHHLKAIVAANPDSVAIHFLGGFVWLRELGYTGDIEGNTSLQIFNSNALNFLSKLGFSSVAVSQEATLQQIHKMSNNVKIPLEAIVQGRTELMISEYCVIGSFLGNGTKINCPRPCMKEQYSLKDRKGELFPLRTDSSCRMHIMNSRDLNMSPYVNKLVKQGVKILRLDLRQRSKEYIEDNLRLYSGLLAGTVPIPEKEVQGQDVTRGHYFKGIFND